MIRISLLSSTLWLHREKKIQQKLQPELPFFENNLLIISFGSWQVVTSHGQPTTKEQLKRSSWVLFNAMVPSIVFLKKVQEDQIRDKCIKNVSAYVQKKFWMKAFIPMYIRCGIVLFDSSGGRR